MASANPYLNFSGNCQEAFEFYRSVLGGDFTGNMKFSDMPSGDDADQEPAPEGIMHISLPFGDSVLMGSDVPPGSGTVTAGNTCYVCLNPDTPDDGKRIFEELSKGGEIEMAYDRQFWGDYFGSFTDRFGIKWMIDVGDPSAEQPAT